MSENPIPEKYRTDHLILLVGSNPLPNWVAGKLLCKPNGKIYLVHSEATKEVAKQLQKRLGKKRCKLRDLGQRQSNSQTIYETIDAILQKDVPNETSVGLNYTGGTKIMSVHAYEAALFFDDKRVVCSYLDAWTLNMVFIGKMGQCDTQCYVARSSEVQFETKILLDLHGIELQENSPDYTLLPLVEICQKMVQIYDKKDNREAWRDYFWGRNNRLDRNDDEYNDDSKYRERISRIKLPETDNLKIVRSAIQQEKPSLTGFDLLSVSKSYGLDVVEVAMWFHGFWLEEYVLQILQKLESACRLNKPAKNFKAKNPKYPDDPKFEFDVAVTRGYQLFAFSCTTSNEKSRCKLKLFEAYVRAKQMGGDEARVALVCGYHDSERLEDDLSYEFDAKERIKVFGLPDLIKLENRIKQWFDTIDNQQRKRG